MLNLLNASATAIKFDFWDTFSFVKNCFVNFTVSDAVDILILSLLFFFLFKFFKNKKTGALLVGMAICLVVFVLATIFNVSGIKFILSGVFQIGALALVIIFQPEIRDLLEKMGSGSINGLKSFGDTSHKKQRQYKTIEEICRAVHVLSVEKTGALIVLERTTQLDEIISTGTRINADVSDSLIRNLFFNRAPLHDGALVIEEDKITAAACILPLPRHTDVDSDLGTRHRAAIGLSETSDALIIVVSEETGVISVAKERELIRNFTSDSLRKFLVREILHEARDEDSNS